ncbi:hypothetical protein ACO2Q8_08265 [Larkinella sp. VNQ87]
MHVQKIDREIPRYTLDSCSRDDQTLFFLLEGSGQLPRKWMRC